MNQSPTVRTIGRLLVIAIVVTLLCSYIPTELNILRQLVSLIQAGLLLSIGVVAVRSLLREF